MHNNEWYLQDMTGVNPMAELSVIKSFINNALLYSRIVVFRLNIS